MPRRKELDQGMASRLTSSRQISELLFLASQHRTPVAAEIAELMVAQLDSVAGDQAQAGPRTDGATFRDILVGRGTLDDIIRVKDIAKQMIKAPGALPAEIPRALYIFAIAAARVHLAVSISRLDELTLSREIAWALAQNWLDADIRSLVQRVGTARDDQRIR